MAELTTAADTTANSCCAPEAQATCCEPEDKADCCGHDDGCGCSAGAAARELKEVRDAVRERYTSAARSAAAGEGCGCAGDVFGADLYDDADRHDTSDAAVAASLGCGVPTAVADLARGEAVRWT